MLIALLSVLGLGAVPASAQSPVPRLVPTRVPAGFTLADYADRPRPPSLIRYIRYFRDEANQRAIYVSAEPSQKSDWDSLVRALRSADATPVKIRTLRGYARTVDGVTVVWWFDKNRILTLSSINIPAKAAVAAAAAATVTRLPDASFNLSRVPAGMGLVYAGTFAGLFGSYSRLTYLNGDRDEIDIEISALDRRAIDIFLLSPFVTYGTTTVNGKPAYVIEDSDQTEVWWEEQPGLLVEVTSDALSPAALVDVAASVAPTDEASWQALVAAAGQASTGSGGTGASNPGAPPASELLGAGMVDGLPWTASAGSGPACLNFSAGGVAAEACVKAPNSLGWTVIAANGKSYAFGVAAANITTAVARANNVEVGRAAVGTVAKQPLLRLFVVPLTAGPTGVTIAGLDAAGVEVSPGIVAGA
jgi:hypothetical protein